MQKKEWLSDTTSAQLSATVKTNIGRDTELWQLCIKKNFKSNTRGNVTKKELRNFCKLQHSTIQQ